MFDELVAEVDAVAALDPEGFADSELGPALVALHRARAQLEAATATLAASFDARRLHRVDGARTAAAWIATQTRCPEGEARRWVRLGRAVRAMPATAAAWLAGRIGTAHVEKLTRARAGGRAEDFDTAEAGLVDTAREHSFFVFARAVDYWCQAADPDRAEADTEAQQERRRVHLSESLDGMWLGDLVLDPISGTIVAGELARLEKRLFDQDWAQAKQRLGRKPTIDELARTPAQRRADALVEMARRSRTAPANGRRPAPLFTVLVGYETFAGRVCELASGTVVAPGALVPWLDEALIERVVFDSPSRVIDVGVEQRLFTGATRRAIQVRDRWCFHPSCHEPADTAQVDHIWPYEHGGPTTTDNGRVACGFHNRSRPRNTEPDPPPHPVDTHPGNDPPPDPFEAPPEHGPPPGDVPQGRRATDPVTVPAAGPDPPTGTDPSARRAGTDPPRIDPARHPDAQRRAAWARLCRKVGRNPDGSARPMATG